MSGYVVAKRAEADLDEIWLHIARDRPSAADRMIDRLIGYFETLAANPQLGDLHEEVGPGFRRSTIGSYVIFHRKRPERVEIIRVIHGARDVDEEFRRHWPKE